MLRVGDKIKIMTANGAQTPFGVAPRIKAYKVVAIFEIGMAEFDELFVYMPLPEAQAFFNNDNAGRASSNSSCTIPRTSTRSATRSKRR